MAKDLTKEDKQRLLKCESKTLHSMAEKRTKAQKEAEMIANTIINTQKYRAFS